MQAAVYPAAAWKSLKHAAIISVTMVVTAAPACDEEPHKENDNAMKQRALMGWINYF